MNRILYSAFFISLILQIPVFSQDTNCEQILTQATDEFNAGRFFSIPTMLMPCLDRGFSNEQKVRAYLILTQTYLILDDPIAADDSYLKLLKADPEYVANPARDPIDVYYLSKKFTTTPVFTPHIRLGFNVSQPRVIEEINTSGTPLDKKDILKPGVQFGIGFDWNINNNWSLGTEANFAYKAFKQEIKGYSRNDVQITQEKFSGFDIPLYVKYSDDSGKIRPFGYAGIAINLLSSSKVSLEFTDNSLNTEVGIKQISVNNENILYKRIFFSQSLVIGGGVKYKLGRDFIYADLRYMVGLSNLTKEDKNYYDEDGEFDLSITSYQFVSDFFRMDNLSLSFGFIHPIYDPRKKTKPKLSGLFKKKTGNEKGNL